jgi:DNA-binding response OmpR family regulator
MRVLLIEDDDRTVKDVCFCLQVRYPEAVIATAGSGSAGLAMAETESPDLMLVDSSLPDIDTPSLVKEVREFSDVPLVILSESETDMDIARGLEAGADESVAKPFSPIELLARVKALLRRAQGQGFRPEHEVYVGSGLTINFGTQEVLVSGEPIKLTPIEYRLLAQLVRNEGRVLPHGLLLERVWGPEYTGDASFVKKYVYRLRSKLEPNGRRPKMLVSQRGVGYRFVRPG